MREIDIRKAARAVLRGGVRKVVRANYDFDVHGGAASTISLSSHIPAHATVVALRTVELTAMADGTAVTFVVGSTDLTGAVVLADLADVAVHALNPVAGIKVAAESEIKVTLLGVFTAGHLDIFVEYLEGNPAD